MITEPTVHVSNQVYADGNIWDDNISLTVLHAKRALVQLYDFERETGNRLVWDSCGCTGPCIKVGQYKIWFSRNKDNEFTITDIT